MQAWRQECGTLVATTARLPPYTIPGKRSDAPHCHRQCSLRPDLTDCLKRWMAAENDQDHCELSTSTDQGGKPSLSNNPKQCCRFRQTRSVAEHRLQQTTSHKLDHRECLQLVCPASYGDPPLRNTTSTQGYLVASATAIAETRGCC